MRGFLRSIVWMVGLVVAVVISFKLAGAMDPRTDRGQTSALVFVLAMAVSVAVLILISRALDGAGRVRVGSWLAGVGDCPYKHAWDGYGIAVDRAKGSIHLLSRFDGRSVAKTYPLSDIRGWRYEMPELVIERGGEIIGGGLTGASRNVGHGIGQFVGNSIRESNVVENTGLYVDVRDIDHPEWFIKFRSRAAHDKNTRMQLRRWMEILDQSVNS